MSAPVSLKLCGIIALGLPLIAVAAALGAYEGPIHDSIKPGHGKVDYWKWRWMNYWYANTEDGNGLNAVMSDCVTRYRDTLPKWAAKYDGLVVWCWSAVRNNANNFKRAYRNDTWLPPGAKSVWPI